MGDVWQLGRHRLMCGDSTNQNDVERLMCGQKADLVFTDPPYGVAYSGEQKPGAKNWQMIKNDDLKGDKLYQFLVAAFMNIESILKPNGAFYIWYATANAMQFLSACQDAGLKVKQNLIWSKGMVLGHSDYHWTYEPCLYGCHKESNSEWYGDRAEKTLWDLSKTELSKMNKDDMLALLRRLYDQKDIWEVKRDDFQEYVHPTQKPVALSAKAMHNSSKEKDIVVDLFGGSGSTLMGCQQLNRTCYTMEFDPKYCDVIIKRYEQFTGDVAKLITE